MNKLKLYGIIRHVLTFGAGFVVAKGYIDDATAQQVIGAIMAVLGTVWSVNTGEKQALQ